MFLICFDMDGTLLGNEPLEMLAREVDRENEVKEITKAAMNGELEFKKALTMRVSLLKGLEVERIKEIAKNLPFVPGAERLITRLKKAGFYVVMITGGFDLIAEIIARRLEIDEYLANELKTNNDTLTGEFKLEVNENKDTLMRRIAERINAQFIVAVGDGANDLKMLKEANIGIGFKAKNIVRKQVRHNADKMDEIEEILDNADLL